MAKEPIEYYRVRAFSPQGRVMKKWDYSSKKTFDKQASKREFYSGHYKIVCEKFDPTINNWRIIQEKKTKPNQNGWIQCTQCGNGYSVCKQDIQSGDVVDRQACEHCGIGPMIISWE